jgi:hypothetical protein
MFLLKWKIKSFLESLKEKNYVFGKKRVGNSRT